MKGFPEEVRIAVFDAQNGYCKDPDCLNKIDDFHHKLPNTKTNRKLFPLFINSPFNCTGLCRHTHTQKRHLFKITVQEAGMYEDYLRKLITKGD